MPTRTARLCSLSLRRREMFIDIAKLPILRPSSGAPNREIDDAAEACVVADAINSQPLGAGEAS